MNKIYGSTYYTLSHIDVQNVNSRACAGYHLVCYVYMYVCYVFKCMYPYMLGCPGL